MSQEVVLSVDIGSTAVKVLALTEAGKFAATASRHFSSQAPKPGWVEQEPEIWWERTAEAIRECVGQLEETGYKIGAVSFSGHMSAPVLLDKDGRTVRPSIMIADARSSAETVWLREKYEDQFLRVCGNVPLDAFTVSKLLWIARHEKEVMEKTKTLLFPKDFIRYRITGSAATDPTDAGNSLLYDTEKRNWSEDLIHELRFPREMFPEILQPHEPAGMVTEQASRLTGLPAGLPVITGAADMACSQLGTGAVQEGILAVTLSTSGQVVMRVQAAMPEVAHQLTFHPSAVPGSLYAMGTIFSGGLGVDWAYRLISGKTKLESADFDEINVLSARMDNILPGSGGLLFLPFLVGSSTPHYDPHDRASWLGLTTGQPPELLLHSVMEGVAYNIRECMEVFEAQGCEIKAVHLGGGGSKNQVWAKIIANVLGKSVHILNNRDASALGAALLAGIGHGWYSSAEEASRQMVGTAAEIACDSKRNEVYNRVYDRYRKVYKSLNQYYKETAEDFQ